MILSQPAHAGVQEMRVLASATDRSSGKAADLALDFAKKRAVYLVARKMQVPDASARCAVLTPDQLAEIIRGATVLQTRRVGEITYADVSVSVVTEALERALKIEPPVTISTDDPAGVTRGVLVLPVYVAKDRPYLWEKENLVDAPVRAEVLRQARGAVLVPAGDFDDRRLVDYQNALDVTADGLKPMFERYGVDEIIIAVVTLGAEFSTEPTQVLLRRLVLPPNAARVEQLSVAPPDSTQDTAARASQAARDIAGAVTQIASATSKRQQDKLVSANKLPVHFRYATASDLAAMQEAVRTAPNVLQLAMPAITLGDMRGLLYYTGDKDALRKAIALRNFVITDEGDGWLISVR